MSAEKPYWLGRKVALTGATGFIGHHLACALSHAGAHVTALVRASSRLDALNRAAIHSQVAPLDDVDKMTEASNGASHFFHLAGAVDFSSNPTECQRTNVAGTMNAYRAATRAGIPRFIYASSIVAIGAQKQPVALNEQSQWNLGPYHVPYASSKHDAETYLLGQHSNTDVVIVNPACAIGPDDYSHSEFGTMCKRFWRGRLPFYSAGGNNFVDVRDVANGMMLAGQLGSPGERYILSGENLSYADFFQLLSRVDPQQHKPRRLPIALARFAARISDILPNRRARPYLTRAQARLLGLWFFYDCGKAKRELGYQFRPVDLSLGDAWAYWMAKKSA